MSKIEELIQQYCPDGVEYVKLGEVCEIERGKVFSKKYIEEHRGQYPVYSSQTANDGELGKIDTYIYDGEYITWTTDGAYAGSIFFRKGKFSITNVCGLIKNNHKLFNIRFLFHWLRLVAKNYVYSGMGNPKLMSNQTAEIPIPIPPLEVQEEIVRILDKFSLLTAELEAELELRRKQYDFYRNQLLSFDSDSDTVQWKKLGEVLYSIRTGLNPRKFFSLNTPDANNYYVTIKEFKGGKLLFGNNTDKINDEAMRLCYNRSHLEKGDLLFSGTGTIGEVLIVEETPHNWNIKEGVYALKPKSEHINVGYLKHILQTSTIKAILESLSEGGTVKSISMKKLADLSIPIPPLSEQQRIVDILDRFDALVNDLSAGLPAEIEARRKQYEYYRDTLLTFKRKAE